MRRKLQKLFHFEGIPWPASVLYNALSRTYIFQHYYDLIAADITNSYQEGAVLDIGTGPGWLLLKLFKYAPGLRLTGLDVSLSMVAVARGNIIQAGLADTVTITLGSVDSLPFGDSTFDLVVSSGSIHHWKHPIEGMNEIYRVLRPGGTALIYDLVRDTPGYLLKETAREFGTLRMVFLWIHGFEEPFYRMKELDEIVSETIFKKGNVRFVGVMGCLMTTKGDSL